MLSVSCSLAKKSVIELASATITELVRTTGEALFWLAGLFACAKAKQIVEQMFHFLFTRSQLINGVLWRSLPKY